MELKIGDRVEYIAETPLKGEKAKVLRIDESSELDVLLEFDNFHSYMHSDLGRGKRGHCYWVSSNSLKLDEVEVIIGKRNKMEAIKIMQRFSPESESAQFKFVLVTDINDDHNGEEIASTSWRNDFLAPVTVERMLEKERINFSEAIIKFNAIVITDSNELNEILKIFTELDYTWADENQLNNKRMINLLINELQKENIVLYHNLENKCLLWDDLSNASGCKAIGFSSIKKSKLVVKIKLLGKTAGILGTATNKKDVLDREIHIGDRVQIWQKGCYKCEKIITDDSKESILHLNPLEYKILIKDKYKDVMSKGNCIYDFEKEFI